MVAVKVKGIVCLQCKKRFLSRNPVEMKYVSTMEAEGLDNHMIEIYTCPKCDALVGFIFEPVKILGDGRMKGIPINKFDK